MKKLLFVEDDPFIRDITSIKMKEHGYEVCIAEDGESALTLFEENKPDIVLLDLDLPGMSGLEVLEQFMLTKPAVPVVIFSNNDSPDIQEKAKDKGAAAFFVKASTEYVDLCTQLDLLLKNN